MSERSVGASRSDSLASPSRGVVRGSISAIASPAGQDGDVQDAGDIAVQPGADVGESVSPVPSRWPLPSTSLNPLGPVAPCEGWEEHLGDSVIDLPMSERSVGASRSDSLAAPSRGVVRGSISAIASPAGQDGDVQDAGDIAV